MWRLKKHLTFISDDVFCSKVHRGIYDMSTLMSVSRYDASTSTQKPKA